MAGTVEWLPDAPGTERDLPVFGSTHPMREVTRSIAFGEAWTPARAEQVSTMFDSLAPEWSESHLVPSRMAAIADALDRGGVAPGPIVELGSGTGVATARLAERGFDVVALDLSLQMLLHAPADAGPRIRGDSSRLPFPDAAAEAMLLVNMLLFPAEIDRVLAPGGALIWVNTLAEETPIHLPPDDVVAALPGRWTARAGRAGSGLWCVARRAPQPS